MRKSLAILRNTLALSVPSVLNPFISFFLVLVISRYLGVEGLGKYSLVLSYVAIFGTLAAMGLGDLCVREVAKDVSRAHLFLVNACGLGALSSVLAVLAMDAVVIALGYESELVSAAIICSFSILASTPIVFMEAIFRSLEKSHYVAITFVAENVVRVGVCVWLLLSGHGVIPLFTAILGTRLFGALLMFHFYVRVVGLPREGLDSKILRFLLRQAPTFTSIVLFSTIHLSIDQIMLSKLQDLSSVGLYSAADRILSISKTVPVAFSSALLTYFSKDFKGHPGSLKRLCEDSLRYVALAVFPVVIGTSVLADQFMPLLYGKDFIRAGDLLRIHMVSLVPFSMVYILAQVLIATDNQRVDLTINAVAAVLNAALNFLLIPPFGAMGAVIATLISIIVFNQLQYWYIRKNLFSLPLFKSMIRPLVAALIMGGCTFLLKDVSVILSIICSAILYGGLIVLMKAIRPDELAIISQVWNNFRKESSE